MQVILCQDIRKLGQVGDVVKVKDGFARNYLLPQRIAITASKNNLKRIEQQKIKRAAQLEEQKKESLQMAADLEKVSCTITVEVNEEDKLYGAVSESEIAQALADEGQTVDKKDIVLDKPIDELGIYDVGVALHPEVTAKFRLWVTKK